MTYFLIYIICAIFIFLLMTLCCKGKYFVDTNECGGFTCDPYTMDYGTILIYTVIPFGWPAALIECYYCYKYGYCMKIHEAKSCYKNIKEKYGKRK